MSVDLKVVRDCIKRECLKSISCEECKFNGFRQSICNMLIICDYEIEKLKEIVEEIDREDGVDK